MPQNILVVDDEAEARRFMERALGQEGYRVMAAHDGEQALELLRMTRRKVALLITDLVAASFVVQADPGCSGSGLGVDVLDAESL